MFIGRTDAEAETPILWPPDVKNWLIWKVPDAGKDWRWEDRGWDAWMASPTQWTWVWINSGSWWWTGRPSMLWFIGSQRIRHEWAAELELDCLLSLFFSILYPLAQQELNNGWIIHINYTEFLSWASQSNVIFPYFELPQCCMFSLHWPYQINLF